jgi:hypothetical protein
MSLFDLGGRDFGIKRVISSGFSRSLGLRPPQANLFSTGIEPFCGFLVEIRRNASFEDRFGAKYLRTAAPL